MPIDGYALCPGGTGKKIKFCCNDFLPELEKLLRMIDGEQYLATLKQLDRLMETPANRERACLMALRCLVLESMGDLQEAYAQAQAFVEKHPANVVAQSHLALAAARVGTSREALLAVLRGIAQVEAEVPRELVEVIPTVVEALVRDRQLGAATALLRVNVAMNPRDASLTGGLRVLLADRSFPLLLKDLLQPLATPDDFPDHDAYLAAAKLQGGLRWLEAEPAWSELTERFPDQPAVWRNLACVRFWLADAAGSAAALRRLAQLDLPADEVVEAEARVMLLEADPLGDMVDMVTPVWTLDDLDRVQTALLSDRRFEPEPNEFPSRDDQPPPRAAYSVFDRPPPESERELKAADVPLWIGMLLLFGKQTDRPAELRAPLLSREHLAQVQAILDEVVPGATTLREPVESFLKRSSSELLLEAIPRLSDDFPPDRHRALVKEVISHRLLQQWTQRPLGALDGRTPLEAAHDAALRTRLRAALLVLEAWAAARHLSVDFNALRIRLGLPAVGPIELGPKQIATISLSRLARVIIEKLSDEDLVAGFRRAEIFGVDVAVQSFGPALLARPGSAALIDDDRVCQELVRTARDPAAAMHWIGEGRTRAESAGRSSAMWDVLELQVRFSEGNVDEAMRVLQHLQDEHGKEPGVMEAVTEVLISVGILRPDGTLNRPPNMPDGAPGEELVRAADMAGPVTEPLRPGELWTPEKQTGGGGKLWVPD